MRPRKSPSDSKVEVQMTPMIDIVFQLLIFFVMSFKIIESEGDLAIKMPAEGTIESNDVRDNFIVPLQVTLLSGQRGELSSIRCNGERLADVGQLRQHIDALVQSGSSELQIDLACDDDLHYEHMMAALTAVSGKREKGQIVPLVKDVRIRKNASRLRI
jgi:biopolymer transport protein ExbD